MLTQSEGLNISCDINVQGRVVAQRGKNSSSTPREMRRGGPLARGVDSMDGAAPGSEWICEWCGKGNSVAGRFCTGCTVPAVHRGACTLPRPRPRIPEAQNSAPASSSSGVASADQTAARCTEEPTCLTEEQRAPQRLLARSKASGRILDHRARPTRRPSRSTTRRRSRSRSRADSMIPEPPLSPVSARGGRPAVGTHGTAAIEALIDLTGEAPPLRSGSRGEEPPPSRWAPGPASSQPVSRLWELLSPETMLRMGLLGRHRAADRGEHEPGGEPDCREPEPEPEPLTLRCESMRLIAGSIRRDPYELLPEADPPA